MFISAYSDIFDAFLQALAEHPEPLPPELQVKLAAASKQLLNDNPRTVDQAIAQILQIIPQLPLLESAYNRFYQQRLKNYLSNDDRSDLTPSRWNAELIAAAQTVLMQPDPIQAAQAFVQQQRSLKQQQKNPLRGLMQFFSRN